MKLYNFHHHILLTAPGCWAAEIQGTDIYQVEVELEGDNIAYWDCDCPFLWVLPRFWSRNRFFGVFLEDTKIPTNLQRSSWDYNFIERMSRIPFSFIFLQKSLCCRNFFRWSFLRLSYRNFCIFRSCNFNNW